MVIAKYIRLSLADQDLMKKENKTESESIVHQRNLIQKYINSHADRQCKIVCVFGKKWLLFGKNIDMTILIEKEYFYGSS